MTAVETDAARRERRAARLSAAHEAVGRLHAVHTMTELLAVAPAHVAGIGFDRCMISRIDDQRWMPQSAWSALGTHSAAAMIDIGTRARKLLDATVVETELMLTRGSLLVTDAQHNDRVHAELRELNRTESYLVVPIVVGTRVSGFIHVDNLDGHRPVDGDDLDALALYGACFGFAVERIRCSEQLASVRRQLDDADQIWPSAVTAPRACGPGIVTRPPSFAPGLETLTKRELEVLSHVAAGATNRVIAAQLFVSESTAKAHVKHIMRKLGATNRAEAVSRYLHALARTG